MQIFVFSKLNQNYVHEFAIRLNDNQKINYLIIIIFHRKFDTNLLFDFRYSTWKQKKIILFYHLWQIQNLSSSKAKQYKLIIRFWLFDSIIKTFRKTLSWISIIAKKFRSLIFILLLQNLSSQKKNNRNFIKYRWNYSIFS